MLFYWKFFLSIIKGGEKLQKKYAQMLIFTLIFTLAIMGAASAADNSSNNLKAQASSTIVANDTTNSNNSAQVHFQNQTGTDPQIEHNNVINPTIYPNIQAAINAAQSGDTIWLENGATFTGTDNTQITISENLNFDVLNSGTATIDGSGTNWGFYINPGYTVSFNNILFQNFMKNSFGAAIANEGILSVTRCTFTSNTAPYSGAIGNIGTCTVTNCTFTDNSATNNGGAIANDGTLTVTGSNFTSNTAGNNGGAIASDGILNIDQCTFTGNNAVNGGAISNLLIGSNIGTAKIHYSRIVDNTAVNGNAIYNALGCFVNAEYNWWGSNNGALGSNYGVVDADPYIMLRLTASPTTINNGDTSTLIADLTRDNYNNPLLGTLPDGIPVIFTLTNGPYGSLATPLTRYTNAGQASIIFTANDPNAPDTQNVRATVDNQQVTCDILINPTAKVVMTKTSNSPVNVGQTGTFTITITNNGPNSAQNVQVTDPVPNGFNLGSISAGTYVGNVWTISSLANGATATLTFNRVMTNADAGTTKTNTATETQDTYNPSPITPQTAIIYVNNAVLTITKTANQAIYNVGDNAIYNIDVLNNGPNTATNVVITDTLPAGLTFVSTTQGGVWNLATRTITWTVDNLANGAHFLATITATVTADAAAKHLINTAQAKNDQIITPVTTTTSIYVTSAALELTKTVNKTTPKINDTVIYTLIVQNHGPDTASSVKVTDVIPTGGIRFVGVDSVNYGTYDPSIGIWTIGDLPANSIAKLVLRFTVERAGTIENKAKVTSITYDPNIYPTEATVTINVQKPSNPNNGGESENSIAMQHTGVPIGGLILSLLMVLGGFILPRKKN